MHCTRTALDLIWNGARSAESPTFPTEIEIGTFLKPQEEWTLPRFAPSNARHVTNPSRWKVPQVGRLCLLHTEHCDIVILSSGVQRERELISGNHDSLSINQEETTTMSGRRYSYMYHSSNCDIRAPM